MAATVGLVVAASAAATSWPHSTSADTFVASVPWSSAVVPSVNGRTLIVQADVQGMDDRFDCGPVVKTRVSETSHEVAVRVDVFNRPLPPNVACGGSGLITVPATIHLKAPLGGRVLTDSVDRRAHQALFVATTPALSRVPTPFSRRSTGWDESTGQVHEWWRWQQHHQSQQIDLDFGPTSTAAKWGAPPTDATHTTVGTTGARVWRQVEGDTVSSTVTWSPRAGQSSRLSVIDQSLHPMSQADVVALARSLR